MSTRIPQPSTLFQSLRPKAERALVYPLNRDECIALIDEGERLIRERDLVYEELNKALGAHAPKAWERIRDGLNG